MEDPATGDIKVIKGGRKRTQQEESYRADEKRRRLNIHQTKRYVAHLNRTVGRI